MEFLKVTILSIIQGLTEFLPISSSAHLILPSQILGWGDQGLAFDVAVHLGTLIAVIWYFRVDISDIVQAWFSQVFKQQQSPHANLGWYLILATIPVIVSGFIFKDFIDENFRNARVIAITTILFGVLLLLSDKMSSLNKNLNQMTLSSALIIGLAQVLALIPGTSRSGITMTAALFCGLDRQAASRFSFLLSIPVIAGASLLLGIDLLNEASVDWGILLYAIVLSAVVAYLCIHYFLVFINRLGFLPFVIYRLLLGIVLFIFFV